MSTGRYVGPKRPTNPRGFRVVWPIEPPEEQPPDELIVPMGRYNGYVLSLHVWRGPQPADADAKFVPELQCWVANRLS